MVVHLEWTSTDAPYVCRVTVDNRCLLPFYFHCESYEWACDMMWEYVDEIRDIGVDAFLASFMD